MGASDRTEDLEPRKSGPAKKSGGILSRIKMLMERNRLGELLVVSGTLTSGELRYALAVQRSSGEHLGHVLLQQRMVTRQALYRTLAQQWALRCMAGITTIIITFSIFGPKQARAGQVRDIPAQMNVVQNASAVSPMGSYPALLGAEEKRSTNLNAFTKWSSMFTRFEAAVTQPSGQRVVQSWKKELADYEGLPLEQMADRVNAYVNKQRYIQDQANWGQTDYWETPVEFFQRGGDCEDYAIAKYVSLRALGVPEERLRIAIVHDMQKNIPHAVLIVYSDSGALVLDNQNDRMLQADTIKHRYRPIFSINRTAWWLHNSPNATVVASAR